MYEVLFMIYNTKNVEKCKLFVFEYKNFTKLIISKLQ